MSNIESLMVNKLANTNQKLSVLKGSEKEDVLQFLKKDGSARGRKRSTSKFRNKLTNVHSIQPDAISARRSFM